jgi:hypothetical protein
VTSFIDYLKVTTFGTMSAHSEAKVLIARLEKGDLQSAASCLRNITIYGGAQGEECLIELFRTDAENAQLAREVAGLRYYIAQLERIVSPEQRDYAAQEAQAMVAESARV